jgi:hypothetical protein
MAPPLVVVGIIAYLSPAGNVDDMNFGLFHDVELCEHQAPFTIAQYQAKHPEVAKDKPIVSCWDTRPVKADVVPQAPAKPIAHEKKPATTDL